MALNSSYLRNSSAYTVSTISVSLVLFIIGTIIYIGLNTTKAANAIVDDMRVVVVLKSSCSESQIAEMKDVINKDKLASDIKYISKEQAEQEFRAYIGEDFVLKLGSNPLPASLSINLSSKMVASESVARIKKLLSNMSGVDEILYQESMMDSITDNISNIKLVLIVIAISLLGISTIMINNTIRMVVFSKRFLIKSMLLIGATKGYVRRPFMGNAILQSFMATILASVLLIGLIIAIKRTIPEIEIIFEDYKTLLTIPATLLVFALFVCLPSTLFAVNRYMSFDDNQLHIY